MILEFAKNNEGTLIHVSEVQKETVYCPFCDNELKPKRGQKKIHHFAHLKGESCKGGEIMDSVDYHLYKKLSPAQIKVIEQIAVSGATEFFSSIQYYGDYATILDLKYTENDDTKSCGLYTTAKTLKSINEKGFFDKFKETYSKEYHITANELSKIYTLKSTFKATLQFFENQFLSNDNEVINKTFERLNNSVLYFIHIKTNESEFQKIGITLDWNRRKGEIERFLKKHFTEVTITPIKITRLAILEHYFKRYYADHQFKVKKSNVTEYFQFTSDEINTIKNQLRIAERSKKSHRAKIMEGLKNRSSRVRGSETEDSFLNKPKNKEIAALLDEGTLSLRKIAQKVGCSVNTVRKVKSKIGAA